VPDDVDALIREANDTFERAQQLLRQGDFAGYAQEIERLGEILRALAGAVGP
jgi:flagellin-specific chaperone FliS